MTACKFCGETGFEWREIAKGWRLFKDDAAHSCRMLAEPPTEAAHVEAVRLSALGYRRTSRRHGIVSRVDRPDWKEYMAKEHSPWSLAEGLEWVECLRGDAADQYRRCTTKDRLTVPRSIALLVPASGWDPVGFVPPFDGATAIGRSLASAEIAKIICAR